MRVKYKAKYDLNKPCVAKLWFGDRYLIVKWPDMKEGLKNFREKFKGGDRTDTLEHVLLSRLRKRIGPEARSTCVVEIILSSSKGEELLAKEQVLLNNADGKCLNDNTTPYRPKWIYEAVSAPAPGEGFFAIKGKHRRAPALVKLWARKKFLIWKCMDIQAFPAQMNRHFEDDIRKYAPRSHDLFNPLVKHVIDNHIRNGHIEVIEKFGYSKPEVRKLLKAEKKMLDQFVGQDNCLNGNTEPHMTRWIIDILHPPKKDKNKPNE